MSTEQFIAKWQVAEASERANAQHFLLDLCDLLGVARPATGNSGAYCFERAVERKDAYGQPLPPGRADLYKQEHFVLEAKQGAFKQSRKEKEEEGEKSKGTAVRGTRAYDLAMLEAKNQAEAYARALDWPPFLLIVDVGHVIEVYADFSGAGKQYLPYPDARSFRISLADLRKDEARARLKEIWTSPRALDPALKSARVTQEVAANLARIAKSLEDDGRPPEAAAQFLMRCIFTMFAEDIQLLPPRSFTGKLELWRDHPDKLVLGLETLWREMDKGGYSGVLDAVIHRFNGGLFHSCHVFPLKKGQIEWLLEAAKADWRDVEPAIFGTLLERALDPDERHMLGAHFTPRAYVERLVLPTVIEPLREEWEQTKIAAATLVQKDSKGAHAKVLPLVRAFHEKLCSTRVLDPACGTGNFLYVTLEHMKRLEGEVLDLLEGLGEPRRLALSGGSGLHTVDPHQFLGIEVNPRAAVIAELVLWIGYLQWHFRTFGATEWPEPVLREFKNIEKRDAVLAWDGEPELVRDPVCGKPVTVWDGKSTKKHPVTGEDVPDESKTRPVYRYGNPRKAVWPAAAFVVGNPPFLGNKRMREGLGDGYVDALRDAHPNVPGSADYVMFWWDHAAEILREGSIRRFGFITTNSITQTQSGQVVRRHLEAPNPASLALAIPDHPWVDSSNGAAVRIGMTVVSRGAGPGRLLTVLSEVPGDDGAALLEFREQHGDIHAALDIGTNLRAVQPLRANAGMCWQGCKLVGEHFQVAPAKVASFIAAQPNCADRLPRYWAGSDVTKKRTPRHVIDLFGLDEADAFRQYPALMQHLVDYVKPERDHNKDSGFRTKWWVFGRPRPDLRAACEGLGRYIVTSEVAKHRVFMFLEWPADLIDGSIAAVASPDAATLAVLSSRTHVLWALGAGGTLEDRPRYQNGPCFDPFPFPAGTDAQRERIRALGEQLDRHRKHQQALHPELTITGMYNVLQKNRAGEALTAKEKLIHEQGLVSTLQRIHDELDAAVADAYGWPRDLSDEQVLERLVALNRERAEEEKRGIVRWLRPEYQIALFGDDAAAPGAKAAAVDQEPEEGHDAGPDDAKGPKGKAKGRAKPAKKAPWPAALPERVAVVEDALRSLGRAVTSADVAACFQRVKPEDVHDILATLVAFHRAEQPDLGCFVAM